MQFSESYVFRAILDYGDAGTRHRSKSKIPEFDDFLFPMPNIKFGFLCFGYSEVMTS